MHRRGLQRESAMRLCVQTRKLSQLPVPESSIRARSLHATARRPASSRRGTAPAARAAAGRPPDRSPSGPRGLPLEPAKEHVQGPVRAFALRVPDLDSGVRSRFSTTYISLAIFEVLALSRFGFLILIWGTENTCLFAISRVSSRSCHAIAFLDITIDFGLEDLSDLSYGISDLHSSHAPATAFGMPSIKTAMMAHPSKLGKPTICKKD